MTGTTWFCRDQSSRPLNNRQSSIDEVGTGWPAGAAAVGNSAMYISDGSHPSPIGAYLSALTFYRTISRQSTLGLPKTSDITLAHHLRSDRPATSPL